MSLKELKRYDIVYKASDFFEAKVIFKKSIILCVFFILFMINNNDSNN